MSNTITTTTTAASPVITFANDPDTGMAWSSGDQLTIVAGGAPNKKIDYKKVHVARRRQAKKLARPEIWRLEEILSRPLR